MNVEDARLTVERLDPDYARRIETGDYNPGHASPSPLIAEVEHYVWIGAALRLVAQAQEAAP